MAVIERNGMKFEAKSDLEPITYINKKDLKAGMEIIGSFEGTFTAKSKFNADGQLLVKIRTADGLKALPGHGNLPSRMKTIATGTSVLVIYKGMQLAKSGKFAGRPVHTYEVYPAVSGTASSTDKLKKQIG